GSDRIGKLFPLVVISAHNGIGSSSFLSPSLGRVPSRNFSFAVGCHHLLTMLSGSTNVFTLCIVIRQSNRIRKSIFGWHFRNAFFSVAGELRIVLKLTAGMGEELRDLHGGFLDVKRFSVLDCFGIILIGMEGFCGRSQCQDIVGLYLQESF